MFLNHFIHKFKKISKNDLLGYIIRSYWDVDHLHDHGSYPYLRQYFVHKQIFGDRRLSITKLPVLNSERRNACRLLLHPKPSCRHPQPRSSGHPALLS